jgi:hypothetical protein
MLLGKGGFLQVLASMSKISPERNLKRFSEWIRFQRSNQQVSLKIPTTKYSNANFAIIIRISESSDLNGSKKLSTSEKILLQQTLQNSLESVFTSREFPGSEDPP